MAFHWLSCCHGRSLSSSYWALLLHRAWVLPLLVSQLYVIEVSVNYLHWAKAYCDSFDQIRWKLKDIKRLGFIRVSLSPYSIIISTPSIGQILSAQPSTWRWNFFFLTCLNSLQVPSELIDSLNNGVDGSDIYLWPVVNPGENQTMVQVGEFSDSFKSCFPEEKLRAQIIFIPNFFT